MPWIGGMSYLQPPDLFECVTMNDILAKVRERARKNPRSACNWRYRMEDEPVAGGAAEGNSRFRGFGPPWVMLMSYSGQAGWLNSRPLS